MNDLPLDRLRIKVERNGSHRVTEKYTHDNMPEELVPYVRQAMQDLEASENPIQSRTYQVGNDRMHVHYKPKWSEGTERHEGNAWLMIEPHTHRYRVRKWP